MLPASTSELKYVLITTIILPPLALATMLWSKDMTKTAREAATKKII